MVHALRAGYDRLVTSMGHVVVEAWIEDFDTWVVLDPQNRAYWAVDGRPLSAVDLWKRYRRDGQRPEFVGIGGGEPQEADLWWSHWADVGVGESALVDERGYAAIFQGRWTLSRKRLLTDHAMCYPQLSRVSIALSGGPNGTTVLNLSTDNPYGDTFQVNGTQYRADEFALSAEPGEHALTIKVATPWGNSATQSVRYRVIPHNV